MSKKAHAWPTRYPWDLLPRIGLHPFIPPKRRDWVKNPPRGPRGYIDVDGNEWVPHYPSPTGSPDDFHWDVQHLDGRHSNVAPDGSIHHGPDNFP